MGVDRERRVDAGGGDENRGRRTGAGASRRRRQRANGWKRSTTSAAPQESSRMLSPGVGAATHVVWATGLVRPPPSHLAARCSDYALVSTEPRSVAAHHDARHQLPGEFTPAACPCSPDDGGFLGGGLAFRSSVRCRAFDRQSAPQPPAENPGQSATSTGQSCQHSSSGDGIQLPQRPCNGLHRLLGTALHLRRPPLRGKALVAYRSPMPSLEEEDAEGEEQSPIGDVGQYMAAGEAVSHRRLKNVDKIGRWTWPTDLDFQQEVEEQTDDRKPCNEHCF